MRRVSQVITQLASNRASSAPDQHALDAGCNVAVALKVHVVELLVLVLHCPGTGFESDVLERLIVHPVSVDEYSDNVVKAKFVVVAVTALPQRLQRLQLLPRWEKGQCVSRSTCVI
jgi:hypothetical protein